MLLDGGVRRGTDVLKALALGATAVAVGRPVIWGLAADGERGAGRVLEPAAYGGRAGAHPVRLRVDRRARAGDGATAVVTGVVTVMAVVAVLSLPWWLPGRVVALRVRVFNRVNGDEGIPVPGDLVGIERFKEVYSHPAAGGRSKGAALSDLFWYWLAPGPEMHQEHLEAGERYDAVARATRGFLSVPRT